MFTRLLKRLGLHRTPEPQKYSLDASLHLALNSLAEKQQRSPDELASSLVASGLALQSEQGELWQRWQSLSPREQDVAALACLGYTNRQIGAFLSISPETVKTHLRNALVKFKLRTRSELHMLLKDWDFSAWGQVDGKSDNSNAI
jgi:DNA-binding CsgD family transcriptional regulator